jgi:hypothetical protein
MGVPLVVQIVGAPIACAQGVQDRWRETAGWAAAQLQVRYGDAVRVDYYDLFDTMAPPLPPEAQLPVVFVDGTVVSSGGKIALPAIRRRLEACGVESIS